MSLIVRLLRRQTHDARRRDIAIAWRAKGSLIMVFGTLLVGLALTIKFSDLTLQNPALEIPMILFAVSGGSMLLCGLFLLEAADGINRIDNQTLRSFEGWRRLILPLNLSVYKRLFQSHRVLFLFCVFSALALVSLLAAIILHIIFKAF